MSSKVTDRQQHTRCGKERCSKCKEGAGHGPYWYEYWSESGRTISKYVGIHLPERLQQMEQGDRDETVVILNPQHFSSEKATSSTRITGSKHIHRMPLQLESQILR